MISRNRSPLLSQVGSALALLFATATGLSATHFVDSITALQLKINEAAPGDTVTLKDGTYATTKAITVGRRATAEQPITITAETVGGRVVAWGSDSYGQSTVPDGLSDVTAIAAGNAHSLALKSDGTVVAWGCTDIRLPAERLGAVQRAERPLRRDRDCLRLCP